MSDSNSSIRLTPLDGLRGLAALMTVIVHYRNLEDNWNETIINTNPLWDQLILVYKFGWIGVEFFFVLSGFNFFCKYDELIGKKAIALTNFAILRSTRFYPPHVATLILTVFLQYLVFAKSNTTFVYGNKNVYDMLLRLSFLYAKVKNSGKILEYVGAAGLAGAVLSLNSIQSFINGNTAMAMYLGLRSTGTSRYASSPC